MQERKGTITEAMPLGSCCLHTGEVVDLTGGDTSCPPGETAEYVCTDVGGR